jgi:hypothetical protein
MTAWEPGGFTAELIAVGRKYAPPSPDMPASSDWGVEETVRERFGDLAASIEFERRELVQEDESDEAFATRFVGTVPSLVAAKQALPDDDFEAMLQDIRDLADRFNEGDAGSVRLRSPYLLTVARKRG